MKEAVSAKELESLNERISALERWHDLMNKEFVEYEKFYEKVCGVLIRILMTAEKPKV